jgi:hypothetical protein
MMLACEVRRVLATNKGAIKIGDFKLTFGKNEVVAPKEVEGGPKVWSGTREEGAALIAKAKLVMVHKPIGKVT